MKTLLKQLTTLSVIVSLSVLAAPVSQAAMVSITIDCTNLQPQTIVPVVGGDDLEISITNCDGAMAWGGTMPGTFADYVGYTQNINMTGEPNSWAAYFDASESAMMMIIRSNWNESRDDNVAISTGATLFTLSFNSSYYSWVVGEIPGGEEASAKLGKVTFGAYSSVLTKSAQKKLKAIGRAALNAEASELIVSGFTAKGSNQTWSEDQRIALAKARANAVKKFLAAWFKSKDVEVKIAVRAVGSKKPVKPNTSEDNRSKNRRVEVSIKSQVA